jgi:hypothetical protein
MSALRNLIIFGGGAIFSENRKTSILFPPSAGRDCCVYTFDNDGPIPRTSILLFAAPAEPMIIRPIMTSRPFGRSHLC